MTGLEQQKKPLVQAAMITGTLARDLAAANLTLMTYSSNSLAAALEEGKEEEALKEAQTLDLKWR